jgi:hypothetical protein
LSKFTLLNQAERLGLFATVWLGATLVWLVVSLPLGEVGPEALLRSRLTSSARQRAALATALILFGVLSMLSWRYLTTPAGFIGGPPSPGPIGCVDPGRMRIAARVTLACSSPLNHTKYGRATKSGQAHSVRKSCLKMLELPAFTSTVRVMSLPRSRLMSRTVCVPMETWTGARGV